MPRPTPPVTIERIPALSSAAASGPVTPGPRAPLWTRQFTLISATYFFVAMIFYLLMTAMAMYAVTRFAASDAQAGIVVGAFVLGAVVTRVVTTPLAIAWGRRRILLIALALYVLTSLAYLWADSLTTLTLVRFLNGMCFGAAGTILATAVQSIVPPARRSEGTGWFSTAMTLSGAVGPVLALQLSGSFGYDALFWATTASTLVALLLALFLRLPEAPPTGRFRISRAGVLAPEAVPVSTVVLVSGLAYGGVLAFLAPYAAEQGYGPLVPSLFFALFAAGTILSRAVLGPMHDRRGDNAVVYPIIAGYAASFLVLALWQTPVGLLVAGALLGLSYGPVISVFQTIAVTVVPRPSVGVATGTFFLFLDLGTGLGPILLGLVVAALGIAPMFLVCAALTAVLALYYHGVHGRTERAARSARA